MMDFKIISDALHMADSMLDVSPADWPRLRAETKKIIARAKDELSSPHPEAREEDIKVIHEALYDMETAFNYKTYHDLEGRGSMNRNEKEYFAAQEKILIALSRLSAPKPKGQDVPKALADWIKSITPKLSDNDLEALREIIVIDDNPSALRIRASHRGCRHFAWRSERCVLSHDCIDPDDSPCDVFEPAAPEPRPAEEPVDICASCFHRESCVIPTEHHMKRCDNLELVPDPAPNEEEWSAIKRILNETDCTDGQFLVIKGHVDSLRSQLAQATNNAQFWMGENSKTTRYYEAQLARKDEGLRMALEEAAQSLEALAGLAGKDETMLEYDQVRGYALNRAMAARAALREHDGRKGE